LQVRKFGIEEIITMTLRFYCDVPIKMKQLEKDQEAKWAKYVAWSQGADTLGWSPSYNQKTPFGGHLPIGLPMRYTEPSGDHYSKFNYGRKSVWELDFEVDVSKCSEDGYIQLTIVEMDTRNARKLTWEKAIEQPVCAGGVDNGATQKYTNKVHYAKCGALTSFEEFDEGKCYIGNVE